MSISFIIFSEEISLETAYKVVKEKKKLSISESLIKKIKQSRAYLDKIEKKEETIIYGVNTGFGSLCDTIISPDQLGQLQYNLIVSHACGTGDKVPVFIVRLMLLLKIINLSKGYSGVELATIKRLIYFFNNDITPVVFEKGSLGASGDLAPLAHLSLPLLGLGKVHYKKKIIDTKTLYKELSLSPLSLKSKEGLALLNGTQFMSAYGVNIINELHQLLKVSNINLAIGMVAYQCSLNPFNELIHKVRPHKGQLAIAKTIREYLKDYAVPKGKTVQDPYSFRCAPQVHGACKDAIDYVGSILETEINAVTDNPTIFTEEKIVLSGGNFHGQPLAMAFDYLAIAIAELGSISERRTFKLQAGNRGLPTFLISNPGLNSGLMITQYTSAAMVSQNKQLASPTSIDSIDSSNGQEDHVSMGANGAVRLNKMCCNLENILAIELLNCTQALEISKIKKYPNKINLVFKKVRKSVLFIENDKEMYLEMEKCKALIKKELL